MPAAELKGAMLEKRGLSPDSYIDYLTKALREIQPVSISGCPFDSTIAFRLNELKYLLDNNLTDNDPGNWEDSTVFENSCELYRWLCRNQPREDLVFSHGDLCGSNVLLNNGEIEFIDLAGQTKPTNGTALHFASGT